MVQNNHKIIKWGGWERGGRSMQFSYLSFVVFDFPFTSVSTVSTATPLYNK
jgi:hypothetical protein